MIGSLTLSYDSGATRGQADGQLNEQRRSIWRAASRRMPDAARLCVGLAAEDAPSRLATLFNLCPAAHRHAARRALSLAPPEMDASPEDDAAARREICRDHALEFLHVWPLRLGMEPDRRLLACLANPAPADFPALRAALTEGSGTDGLPHDAPGGDLAALDPSAFGFWLERGDAAPGAPLLARVLGALRALSAGETGRVDLPAPDASDLREAFARPLPARDAGTLADHRQTPLLRGLIEREGVTLFVRIVARALDLLASLGDGAVFSRARRLQAALPHGFGLARAARGLLLHRAVVENGKIRDYAVLSPTAWHLTPGGLLESCLASLGAGAEPRRNGELLLSALDPCVPATVKVCGHA
jgi:hypothetical protein